MNDDEPHQRARAAALRYLSQRPRSEAEVRTRLLRRFQASVAEEVVGALKEQGLLDDARFARLWSESRDSHRPRSAAAIRRELMSRGIDKALADEAVDGIDDEETAYRAGLTPARRLAQGGLSIFRRRLWGYLQRRGYSPSVSHRTINRLWAEMNSDSEPQGPQARGKGPNGP